MTRTRSALIPILFAIYCLLMVWIILFKLSASPEDLHALTGTRSVNLIPFHYDAFGNTGFHWSEVQNNVLIFIPFGVYLKMMGLSGKKAILWGLLVSFGFELSQFLFRLGASDLTDLLTNTLGAAIGVCCYRFLCKVLPSQETAHRLLGGLALLGTLAVLALLVLLIAGN